MSTCSSQEAVQQDRGLQSKVSFIIDVLTNFRVLKCTDLHKYGNSLFQLLYAAWWYFFSKIVELLDTVSSILAKPAVIIKSSYYKKFEACQNLANLHTNKKIQLNERKL